MTRSFKYLIIVLGQILILLSISNYCFSQSKYKITYGDLDTISISVERFMQQKQLKIPDGLFIDSAFVYFSIPNQTAIVVVKYFPNYDSINFKKYSAILIPGSTVNFEVFIKDENHKSFAVQLSYLFNSMADRNIISSSPKYLEWVKLREFNYITGTIYFSGNYFRNVVAFRIQKDKSEELKKLFDRCAIGTVITFENTSYRNDQGILVTRNDSFMF